MKDIEYSPADFEKHMRHFFIIHYSETLESCKIIPVINHLYAEYNIDGVASSEVRLFAYGCVCYRVIDDPSDCGVLSKGHLQPGPMGQNLGYEISSSKV